MPQIAPAMNTLMWSSPLTGRQLAQLVDLGREATACTLAPGPSQRTIHEGMPPGTCPHCGSAAAAAGLGLQQGVPATGSSGGGFTTSEARVDGSFDARSSASSIPGAVSRSVRDAVTVVPPDSKRLACGDVGVGAMASVDDVVEAVRVALEIFRPNRLE